MTSRLLAGAACAALMTLCVPVSAATIPHSPAASASIDGSADAAVTAFYAHRNGAPLWLRQGPSSPAASQLINVLRRAPLDGLASGPALAAQAEKLIGHARAGDAGALARAERLLSTAWVMHVAALQRAPAGMMFADNWAAPRREGGHQILMRAAAAPSLTAHLNAVADVNPVYAQLRDAAWQQLQVNGGAPDPRVLASLDRVRAMPFQNRYVIVDAASARLWMVENGRIADSMKVIVGKRSTQTPMLGSTIYYATLNPYWNVPQDLVQRLIAPRVLEQGVGYLKSHGYEVLADYDADADLIDPAKVDWRSVADGRTVVKVRQLPGPGNSMGRVKFGFPNAYDVFLHDTPKKELFQQADRDVSNGCIRLEDADRLGRWLLGRQPAAASDRPEQHVLLPKPVPIYVTYLTAHAEGGQLTFVDDVYGHDAKRLSAIAALN